MFLPVMALPFMVLNGAAKMSRERYIEHVAHKHFPHYICLAMFRR